MLELRPTCEHCNKALPPESPVMYLSALTSHGVNA
jgi:hypothetical protein